MKDDNIFVWLDSSEFILESSGNIDLAHKVREIRDEYLKRLESRSADISNESTSGS
jgi:hypothetical protein